MPSTAAWLLYRDGKEPKTLGYGSFRFFARWVRFEFEFIFHLESLVSSLFGSFKKGSGSVLSELARDSGFVPSQLVDIYTVVDNLSAASKDRAWSIISRPYHCSFGRMNNLKTN